MAVVFFFFSEEKENVKLSQKEEDDLPEEEEEFLWTDDQIMWNSMSIIVFKYRRMFTAAQKYHRKRFLENMY